MKKLKLLQIFILVTAMLTGMAEAFGYAATEQTVKTSVQPAVAIEKTSSAESGTISPETGAIIGELKSSFNIQANESEGYDFMVYSKILTTDGEISAFDTNGNLFFGNTSSLPTSTAVNNAKTGNHKNADVIGYKFNIKVNENMTIEPVQSEVYDESYKVKFSNNALQGTLTQSISGSPVAKTYSAGEDTSGNYSVTVYITAIKK